MSAEDSLHELRQQDESIKKELKDILDKLVGIEASQKEVAELLLLFKNTKGFISTLRGIGVLVVWVSVVGGAIGGIGYALKTWVKGGGGL